VALGYQRLLRRPDVKLEHLAAIRLPLETAIASLAAVQRTDDHLAQLEKAQKVLANPRRTLESHVKADVAFHAILADATGNPLFQVVLEPIAELLSESRRQTLEHYGAELAHRHHEKILDAVRRWDREAAAQAMREHIDANYRHLAELAEIAPTPAAESRTTL
jgi:DNA-binding FadR family transcriptional regulator